MSGGGRLKPIDAPPAQSVQLGERERRQGSAAQDGMSEKTFANLIRSKNLVGETNTKGFYEKAFKEVFLELHIPATYELRRLTVQNGETKTVYLPDFITNLVYHGKQVLFEPHTGSDTDEKFADKMKAIKQAYGDQFYIVVIRYPSLENRIETVSAYADEVWYMPKIVPQETRKKTNRAVKSWKNKLRRRINGLIAAGAAVVRDPEGQKELETGLFELVRKAS
jgi:hypothetical protein